MRPPPCLVRLARAQPDGQPASHRGVHHGWCLGQSCCSNKCLRCVLQLDVQLELDLPRSTRRGWCWWWWCWWCWCFAVNTWNCAPLKSSHEKKKRRDQSAAWIGQATELCNVAARPRRKDPSLPTIGTRGSVTTTPVPTHPSCHQFPGRTVSRRHHTCGASCLPQTSQLPHPGGGVPCSWFGSCSKAP